MSRKSVGQEIAEELIGKAVVWGPPIAGGLLLGPAGVVAGVAAVIAIISSCNSGDDSAPNASQSNDTGSSTR
ncbi:hypothetical protein GC163_12300 [bacterium]|nr:hypothetical protein [bacterium]